jgi:5-enolpyruvylshikimate-3-phosphate synthase
MFLPEIEALIVQELRMLFLAAVALHQTRIEQPLRNSDQVALLLIFVKLGGQLQLRFAVD